MGSGIPSPYLPKGITWVWWLMAKWLLHPPPRALSRFIQGAPFILEVREAVIPQGQLSHVHSFYPCILKSACFNQCQYYGIIFHFLWRWKCWVDHNDESWHKMYFFEVDWLMLMISVMRLLASRPCSSYFKILLCFPNVEWALHVYLSQILWAHFIAVFSCSCLLAFPEHPYCFSTAQCRSILCQWTNNLT